MPRNLERQLSGLPSVEVRMQDSGFNLGCTARIPIDSSVIQRVSWRDHEDQFNLWACTQSSAIAPLEAQAHNVGLYLYSQTQTARRMLSLYWSYNDSPAQCMEYRTDSLHGYLYGTRALCAVSLRQRAHRRNVLKIRAYCCKIKPHDVQREHQQIRSANLKPWASPC